MAAAVPEYKESKKTNLNEFGDSYTKSETLDACLDYVESIADRKKQLKENNAMLKDLYENDSEYHDVNEEVKDARLKLKAVKNKITADNPDAVKLKDKIDSLKENIKGDQYTLQGYLDQYVTETNNYTFEDKEGKMHSIVKNLKVVTR